MPKKPRQHKNTANTSGVSAHRTRHIPGIADLLARAPLLRSLNESRAQHQQWRDWLVGALPAELGLHVLEASRQGDLLVVYAESAAWCTRLRYALAAMEQQIRARDAAVRQLRVRVRPGRAGAAESGSGS
jgi:predicted nucleic acid-binding Zn ribbon protein